MRYAILLSLSLMTLGLAAPAAAESETYECTTTVGLANPAVSGSLDLSEDAGIALGGCSLVTLSEASTVESLDPADGCSISVDETGDGVGDGDAAEGTTYDAGASFTAFCDIGVTEATSAITFAE